MNDEEKERIRQKLKELDIELDIDDIQIAVGPSEEQIKQSIKDCLEDPEFGPLFRNLFGRVAKLGEINEQIDKINEAINSPDGDFKKEVYKEITGNEPELEIKKALIELLVKAKKINKEIRGME